MRGKPPADPAARAQLAARECRDATRAAHEAMKGMREAEADLRALLAEAREFAAEVVPAEVKRQLAELGPATEAAMRANVEKVGAEFDRLAAIMLGTENDGQPSIEELITARAHRNGAEPGGMACRNCGESNDAYTGLAEGNQKAAPKRGSRAICWYCTTVSIFDHSPLGELILREPTESEATRIAADEKLQCMVKDMQFTRTVINKSGSGNDEKSGPVTACPHCGAPNTEHEPFNGTHGAVPWRGSVTVCCSCWKVAVFTTNPIGELTARKPTPEEATKFARDETLQQAIGKRRRAKDRA